MAELTDSTESDNPARERALAAVPAIREALVMREAGERADEPVPDEAVRRAMLAQARSAYPAAMSALPGLLRGATGAQLVHLARIAMFLLLKSNHLGLPDLARDAARLGLAEARKLDDPGMARCGCVHLAQLAAGRVRTSRGGWPAAGCRWSSPICGCAPTELPVAAAPWACDSGGFTQLPPKLVRTELAARADIKGLS